jgi:acetyltransferase-like isoleucine patch superfamily enzyme
MLDRSPNSLICGVAERLKSGDDVLIASHVALTSQSHDKDAKIYRETMIGKPIVIEDNVWICTGAVALPGV